MRKITNSQWEKIEKNRVISFSKIGFYDEKNNRFEEVARWRNTIGSSGANYGLLQIWTPIYNISLFENQGGYNTCGGYNKPIANLEGCFYQLKKAIENHEIVTDRSTFNYSNRGSITSLMNELKDHLQYHFNKKLLIIDIL